MTTHHRALAASALVIVLASTATGAAAQSPCEGDEHAALDALLGDWRVVDDEGRELGRSTIRRASSGCAVLEVFRDTREREVTGLLYPDPATGTWHGAWVDADGAVVRATGEPGGERVVFEGDAVSTVGSARGRFTFDFSGERIERTFELSTDGGASWSVLSTAHLVAPGTRPAAPVPTREPDPPIPTEPRRATAEPAPAPRPAPERPAPPTAPPRPPIERSPREADRPAPAPSTVEVLSAEATGPSPDPIRMASPMRLQLPLGPVENLPEGYGWSSTDTALYVTEGISIQRVSVKQRRKGGRREIEATLELHAGGFLERIDLGVELLGPDGAVAASETLTKVSVGRGIPEQSEKGAVSQSVRLRLEGDAFDALFAAEERPQLRMTVTVRD